MQTFNFSPAYASLSPEQQTQFIERINQYVSVSLPHLVECRKRLTKDDMQLFREGIVLLSAFPQFFTYCMTLAEVRFDYDQYIMSLNHQFGLFIHELSNELTVSTTNGQRVIVLSQTQSLRRGRPTQQESEQRKREEQEAAHAEAVSRLLGASISTTEAAPIQERESDTSRRQKDSEPDLFSAAVTEQIKSEAPDASSPAPADFDPSDPSPIQTVTPHSSLLTPSFSLKDLIPFLTAELAARVRSVRDLRAERAHESETAKLLLEQGGSIADMQPHTQRAKELDREINDIYAEVDNQLSWLYVMLTEVNPEWKNVSAKYQKATGECFERLTAVLKPYLLKVVGDGEDRDARFNAILENCKKAEQARIAAETRDPAKEKEMHKMDAYIRRKDVKPSAKRLATMQQYRDKLAEMGADADALAAYDVFITAVEKELT